MKNLARLSFVLVTVLWGSFYAVAKEALQRLDPIIFTFFEVASLVPIALTIIVIHRKELNAVTLKRGIFLGSWQCLALLTVTTAEQFTTATSTAFFPGIGGVIGALATGLVLKHPVKKATWMACVTSLGGTCIILAVGGSSLVIRGNIIAFLGAIFFTTYFFFVDHDHQKHDGSGMWSVIGIEHITIVLWLALITLLFGNWQHIHPELPKDVAVIIYVGGICTFLPIVLINFMQRYIPPLEVAFISILEPIWGIIIAHLYLEEVVPHSLYLGGALILAAALLHIWSTAGKKIGIKKALRRGSLGKPYRLESSKVS